MQKIKVATVITKESTKSTKPSFKKELLYRPFEDALKHMVIKNPMSKEQIHQR